MEYIVFRVENNIKTILSYYYVVGNTYRCADVYVENRTDIHPWDTIGLNDFLKEKDWRRDFEQYDKKDFAEEKLENGIYYCEKP